MNFRYLCAIPKISYHYVLGADSSQHNSPRFIQRTSSPYQHIYSNNIEATNKNQPAPPPYPPHLSTVMPMRTRSPLVQPRLLHNNTATPTLAPPTTAPPPAPSSTPSSSNKRSRRRNASSDQKSGNGKHGCGKF